MPEQEQTLSTDRGDVDLSGVVRDAAEEVSARHFGDEAEGARQEGTEALDVEKEDVAEPEEIYEGERDRSRDVRSEEESDIEAQVEQELEGEEVETVDKPSELDSTYEELLSVGVDLGVRKSEIPESLHDAYDNLAEQALVMASETAHQQLQAQEAMLQINELGQKLRENPDKILLTMAVTNPDAFENAVQTFERMRSDERERELVMRELQADAQLSAAQRREHLQTYQQRMMKARKVERATELAAKRHGVNADIAKKFVAQAIQANGGDLDLGDVEPIIKDLAPQGARRVRKKRVATPEKKVAERTAPTESVEGKGTGPGTGGGRTDEASPGLENAERSPFRRLVREAGQKLGTVGR